MSQPVALRVTNLSKSFLLPHEKRSTLKSVIINPFQKKKGAEHHHVLKNISFEVQEGEFLGIVGRNGGGKSTLLKILASVYTPGKGTIEVNGKLVPFIELGVGFNPELTGRDNVYLNGALLGFSDAEIDEIYEDIVSFAELERFMDQKLKNYSSGMQVRLAFSLATRAKADILLVDEVLAVGDVAFQKKCYDYFASLKKEKKTVVFISHDMDAVREYCTRAILIDSGEIVSTGPADKIAEAYMKLFSGQNHTGKGPETAKRWGNGSIHMEAGEITISHDTVTLQVSAVAKEDIDNLTIGISVHSADGAVVCGTNTDILRKKLPSMKKGETTHIEWEIPNIFRDGSYDIAFAAHGPGGLPVYDWWNNAVTFESAYGRRSPYPVSPDIILKVNK